MESLEAKRYALQHLAFLRSAISGTVLIAKRKNHLSEFSIIMGLFLIVSGMVLGVTGTIAGLQGNMVRQADFIIIMFIAMAIGIIFMGASHVWSRRARSIRKNNESLFEEV